MRVLITGGAGYVGSHAVRSLIRAENEVCVFDNLATGHAAAIDSGAAFIQGDLADRDQLQKAFSAGGYDAVIHFAGSIEVGESVKKPLAFYQNNITNSINLLEVMKAQNVRRLVFSSTCAVIGVPPELPLTEEMPLVPASPYAKTKAAIEWALADCATAWGLGSTALRYFNAAGAASDGSIGEDHDPETHLIPNVLKVALGQAESVQIFGTDYETPDGTCIRDYIHVDDLAEAHVLALRAIRPSQMNVYNVGTGHGASVREIVDAARRVTGHAIFTIEKPRRAGDVPVLYADVSKIRRELKWAPRHTDIDGIVASAWNWHRTHPNGYGDRR